MKIVAQKRGYGRYFHDQFPRSKRTYVVLTATRNDSETRRLDTICRAVAWSQLRRLPKTNGKWVRDLFLSLANLDYPEFRAMKTKDIHVTHVGSVLSCHEILSSVADRLGVWRHAFPRSPLRPAPAPFVPRIRRDTLLPGGKLHDGRSAGGKVRRA